MKKIKIKISRFNIEISRFNQYLIAVIFLLFTYLFYLSIPVLYDYESLQKDLKIKLSKEFNIKISSMEDIKYRILPSPNFEILNTKIYGEKKEKFGEIKKMKIHISSIGLFDQENVKIKRILITDSIFIFNEKNLIYLKKYFKERISPKKILIKKSKLFIKDKGITLAFFPIKSLKLFYDSKNFFNFLSAKAFVFGSLVDLSIKNNFGDIYNLVTELNVNSINLKIKNNHDEQKNLGYTNIDFIGSKIKFLYETGENKIILSSKNSRIQNVIVNFKSDINFKPFYFDAGISLEELNLMNILNNNFILKNFINNNIKLNKNFNGKILLDISKLPKNKIFDKTKINIEFQNSRLIFDKTIFLSEEIGKMTLSDSEIFLLDDNYIFKTKVLFNIKNADKFYKKFQIPKNDRTALKKINFEIKKNLTTDEINILNFKINPKNRTGINEKINLILQSYFNENKIDNWIKLKKFVNLIFDKTN